MRVYWRVQQALHVAGAKLIMVDDAAANLAPAGRFRWRTVWVHRDSTASNAKVDYAVGDLWQVARVLQELGVMDERHRVIAEHRLTGCPWAQRVQGRALSGGKDRAPLAAK